MRQVLDELKEIVRTIMKMASHTSLIAAIKPSVRHDRLLRELTARAWQIVAREERSGIVSGAAAFELAMEAGRA